jgi:hypothetical protein
MNKITYSFSKALQLVLKHSQIFTIILLFSLRPLVNLFITIPSLVSWIVSFIQLGWLGTRFEFIKDAYKNDQLPWNQFGNLIVKYIKKLFPIVAVLMIMAIILFIIALIYYSKWYLGDTPLSTDKTIEKQQIVNIITSLRDPQAIQRFMTQFGIVALIAQSLFSVLSFIGKIALTILVVEGYGVIKSFLKSLNFIKNHLLFFVVVIAINLTLSTIVGRILPLFGTEWMKNLQINILLTYIIGIPNKFISLIIEAATVIYYLENRGKVKKTALS